jgi:hypothetical protein
MSWKEKAEAFLEFGVKIGGKVWEYLEEEQNKYNQAQEKLESQNFEDWDEDRLINEHRSFRRSDWERRIINNRLNELHSNQCEDDCNE